MRCQREENAKLGRLIRHEREHAGLDFKERQYTKDQHEALLKDVLSMANADVEGARHIICGVDDTPGGSRTIVGIPVNEFVDAATYQQLVRTNIEPDLHLEYVAHEIDDKKVGVFRISGCDDQP